MMSSTTFSAPTKSERLHVLAVSHAYPRRSNSSHGVFIHRLHRAMRELGARVDVLQASEWAPPRPVSDLFEPWRAHRLRHQDLLDQVDGIPVHHPRVFTPQPSRLFGGDPWQRESRAIARYCARRAHLASADVVLGHFMVPDGVHALELGRALALPVAALAWGDDVHAWPLRSDEWRRRLVDVLEGVDLPIACSHRLVRDGNEWLPAPRDDWEIIYGGVDLDRFSPGDDFLLSRRKVFGKVSSLLERDVRVLLMVGQPVAAKGYVELLDAWREVAVASPRWRLAMVGGPGDLDIPSMIAERGLGRCAYWMGMLPAELMPDLMRAVDAFVLPSHNEGLSLSVLEALATGVPTITTDVGGHAEVIRSADEGWLIPPHDVNALRWALIEVTTSDDERTRRGAAGRRAAERIGTPVYNASRLLACLSDLRARRCRRTAAMS